MARTAAHRDRNVAGTAVKVRLVAWLIHHPVALVFVLLIVLAAFSASIAALLDLKSTVPASHSAGPDLVAPETLPVPTQRPPQRRVDAAHQALHSLGRACDKPMVKRSGSEISEPLTEIESFAIDFPSGGFEIDGEPGSTLALMIVVLDQMRSCDSAYVPQLEDLVPARYRGS